MTCTTNLQPTRSDRENCRKAMKLQPRLVGTLVLMAMPVAVNQPLKISAAPAVSFAPAHLFVRATIEAVPQNRGLRIVADSDDFYRASEVELDGEKAARTNIFEFRSLPSGSYVVTAFLLGADGRERASVRTQVSVFASALNR
jgi:hypothetical protein